MKRFPLRSFVLILAAFAGVIGAALPALTWSGGGAVAPQQVTDKAPVHAPYEPSPQQLNIALLLATAPR